MNTSSIISQLGGSRFIADELGLQQNRISNWLKQGIPTDIYIRADLAILASKKGVALPDDFTAGLVLSK
jgi:hypothetical protein|tara:strand:- start:3501 stop:3707 length:207 start_codon:yes stop_codon:yes gene_type:complete